MIEEGIKTCPFCGSMYTHFDKRKRKHCCEDCGKFFDKPVMSESIKENTIDTRKITAFLASSIKLTAERDLISSVAAESNGADHRTYIELNRCEYDNAIQMTGTQQEMYDSWIRDSDVFILVVSKSGIGEWTEKEIAIAAERKKSQNIKTLAFVQNGSEGGSSAENERWKTALSEYESCFDDLEHYDDISDLYDKVRKHIAALRGDNSIGTVIKDCQRVGYDIVITGISEKSREYVYSLADKFNIINNENFRENEKNSLIFNLQINLDDLSGLWTNVNDYYFILAEGNKEAVKRIGECYQSGENNPHMFLDVNVKESENSESIMSEISSEINGNYLSLFHNRETIIGKELIRSRLEKIKRAYEDFQKGLRHYEDGNYSDAEGLLLDAVNFGFVDACFYLGWIYCDKEHAFFDIAKGKEFYLKAAENGITASLHNLGNVFKDEGDLEEAEKHFNMAAERGSLEAWNNLGVLNEKNGNTDKALECYRAAADKGHMKAQNNLGVLLMNIGETKEAKKYFLKAANNGYASAQGNLGTLAFNEEDTEAAEKYWLMAAEQGESEAQHNLSVLYKRKGDTENWKKYMRMAADNGLAGDQYNLSILLLDLDNRQEAEAYLRKAADQGLAEAQHNLGALYANSGDKQNAEEYFRKAAESGYVLSQHELGRLLWDNENTEEGIQYLRLAAEQGYLDAQNDLGVRLLKSGETQEAEKWFRAAAEQGSAQSRFNLGHLMSQTGREQEAKEQFRMAADQGFKQANYRLGILPGLAQVGRVIGRTSLQMPQHYRDTFLAAGKLGKKGLLGLSRLIVEKNEANQAEKNLRTEAATGNIEAQYQLGLILQEKKKYSEARKYFEMAARLGHEDAKRKIGL